MHHFDQSNKPVKLTEGIAKHLETTGIRLSLPSCTSSAVHSTQQRQQANQTMNNVICRPAQLANVQQQSNGLALPEASWLGSQQNARGNIQLSGPSVFQPHLCYGYVPAYHGFVSGSCADYLTFGKSSHSFKQLPSFIAFDKVLNLEGPRG